MHTAAAEAAAPAAAPAAALAAAPADDPWIHGPISFNEDHTFYYEMKSNHSPWLPIRPKKIGPPTPLEGSSKLHAPNLQSLDQEPGRGT